MNPAADPTRAADLIAAHAAGVAATLPAFVALLFAIHRGARERMARWFDAPAKFWRLPAVLLAYALGVMAAGGHLADEIAVGFSDSSAVPVPAALALAVYLSAPTLVLYARGPYAGKAGLADFAVVALLWFPIELKWVQKSIAVDGGSYPISVFCAVVYGLLVFTSWRRLEIGCDWALRWKDLAAVGSAFAALFAAIVPAAIALTFAYPAVQPRLISRPWVAPLVLCGYFFAPAFCEEFMFRGLIQGLLLTRLRLAPALAAASAIFGLAHVNNAVQTPVARFGTPDWTYVGFATIAGLGYGYVYHRTRSLVASSMVHALVDFTWWTFFRGV